MWGLQELDRNREATGRHDGARSWDPTGQAQGVFFTNGIAPSGRGRNLVRCTCPLSCTPLLGKSQHENHARWTEDLLLQPREAKGTSQWHRMVASGGCWEGSRVPGAPSCAAGRSSRGLTGSSLHSSQDSPKVTK